MSKISEALKKSRKIVYEEEVHELSEEDTLESILDEIRDNPDYQGVTEDDLTIGRNGEIIVNKKKTGRTNG